MVHLEKMLIDISTISYFFDHVFSVCITREYDSHVSDTTPKKSRVSYRRADIEVVEVSIRDLIDHVEYLFSLPFRLFLCEFDPRLYHSATYPTLYEVM